MAVFDNGPKGTLRETVATGVSAFGDFLFHHEGLVDIQTGVLAFRSQTHVFKAGERRSGAGRTGIESAVNLAGASTFEAKGTVELRGLLQGQGGFDRPGRLIDIPGSSAGARFYRARLIEWGR